MPGPPSWTRERVFQTIDIPSDKNGCWLWNGPLNRDQPQVGRGAAALNIARFVWGEKVGPLESDARLFPTCGNRRCVNPLHRQPRLARCAACIHPERQAIDAALLNRTESYEHLASRFGLGNAHVHHHYMQHLGGVDVRQRRQIFTGVIAARERAATWLAALLADGALVPVRDVERLAERDGIVPYHLTQARAQLGALSERRPGPPGSGRRGTYNAIRLPTQAELAEREQRRSWKRTAKVYTDQTELEWAILSRLSRRGVQWTAQRQVLAWFGKPSRALVLAALDKLIANNANIESNVTVVGDKSVLSIRRKPHGALVEAAEQWRARLGDTSGPIIVPRVVLQPSEEDVARLAELIYAALLTRGTMSTNDLHNHLGSSRRGSAVIFNAALDKLVQEGRITRTVEGKTNYYEVVSTASQQASA